MLGRSLQHGGRRLKLDGFGTGRAVAVDNNVSPRLARAMKTGRIKLAAEARMRPPFSAGSMAMALLLMGTGVFIGLAPFHVAEEMRGLPAFLLHLFGGIFVLAGSMLMARSASALADEWRRPRGKGSWYRDYSWNATGISDRSGHEALLLAGKLVFFALLLLPYHAILWVTDTGGPVWVFYAVIGLFDVFLLTVLGQLIYRSVRWLRFGTKRIHYRSFPFFSGDFLRVRFEGGTRLAAYDVKATLRLVENVAEEVRNNAADTSRTTTVYQLWHQDITTRTDAGGFADLTFFVPENAPATSLRPGAPWCLYWEVVVKVPKTGEEYEGTFLVPIYRRSVASRTTVSFVQAA